MRGPSANTVTTEVEEQTVYSGFQSKYPTAVDSLGGCLSNRSNPMQVFDMAETAPTPDWSFYEFFAGGGMARAGLGPEKSGYASLPMFLVA